MTSSRPIAVISGAATDGIGTAITKRFVSDGFHVLGSYETDDSTNASALKNDVEHVDLMEVDHSNRSSLLNFVNAIPDGAKVAALINAQFFFAMENPEDFDHSLWDRSLAINLTAPNFLFHSLKERFAEECSVVTITSTEGFSGSFGASAYAATKAAIHNLTKTWANNAGPRKVRANAIAAGWIGGVMDTDDVFNMSRSITPLGRLGSPEEVASVAAFLVSPQSSFVNGSVITADGGYSGVDTISKFEFEAEREKPGS